MPTQSNDKFGNPAIEYSKNGQTWKVKEGVKVLGDDVAIYSLYNRSTLKNKGDIYAYDQVGVHFQGNNAKVVNEKSGVISGPVGVYFDANDPGDTDAMLINYGKIFGWEAAVAGDGPGDFKVENYGDIYGVGSAIYIQAGLPGGSAGPVLMNHHTISSGARTIYLETNAGLRAKIVNDEDGLIKGGKVSDPETGAAIWNDDGDMKLTNKGQIKGDIVGSDEQDKITNKGTIKGNTFLRDGDDTFNNKNGKAGMVVGMEGQDKLIAGQYKDKFAFSETLDGTTNVDQVKKFESGKDKFLLDQPSFGDLTLGKLAKSAFQKGSDANDASDRIIYKKGSGELFFDEDGDGAAGKVLVAILDAGQKLKYSDFTVVDLNL